jgi:rubrerythrin
MDILTTAISFEEEGEKFYWEIADKTENRGIKNICLMLARDEAEHIKALEKMGAGIKTIKADSSIIEDTKTVFRRFINDIFDPNESLADKALYGKAMELEKKTIEYYKHWAAETGKAEEKALLEKLAAEETRHLEILKNILEYLKNGAKWIKNRKFDDLGK